LSPHGYQVIGPAAGYATAPGSGAVAAPASTRAQIGTHTGGSVSADPPAPSGARGTAQSPRGAAPIAVASPRWGLALAVLVVGMFMSVLDVTIVNVAVPAIQTDFGGSLRDVLWIATAYTLTLGVVVPVSGWLGDRFGLRRVYLLALLGFAAGSALCAIAWSLNALIVFRIVQAVSGGILPVVTMTLIYRIVPRNKIGTAMGMYGLGVVFAPAVGPVLGGYLVEYVNWRLVFYINVPIGLLGAAAAAAVIPKVMKGTARRFDLAGFATIALGLFAILLAASKGEDWGWTGYRILMLFTAGLLSVALFVVIELEVTSPLLDLRLLKIWPFSNSLLLSAVLFISLLAVAFYVPVYLQQGQGFQAFNAGLLTLPQALVMGVLMPLSGRIYDKIGARWLAIIGLAICAVGTYLLVGITPDMTRAEVITWTCVRAAGMGMAMMPIMTAGLSAVPPALTNQASALTNVVRQVAAALGLAALAALATTQQAQLFADRAALTPATKIPRADGHTGPLTAKTFAAAYQQFQHMRLAVLATSYSNLFLLIAALTATGVVLALFLRSGPAAPSTPPQPTSTNTHRGQQRLV
jgi:EmrB/QacA subfamily drug resistance transporter